MKILDYLRSKIAKIPLSSNRSSLSTFFGGGSTKSNNYYTGWVYLAVSIIAEEVAGIELKLFKQDSKGNTERTFDHPAIKLLYKANDFFTQYDLFERLQSNQELNGNEYWFISYGVGNIPISIYPLNPQRVTPVADSYEYIKGYIYTVDGETFQIPKKNIIHFKKFNPKSDIVGMSTLEAARLAADTDNFAREYNKKYFENSARPDVILEFPEALDSDQENRLLQAWHQNHGGPSRQFKTAVASGGLKINSFQISQRDMEFLQGRQFNRDEIMAIFRVPLAVAGFTGNETYASAKAAAYAFGSRTIKPKMKRIVNTLNEFFLPLFPDSEGLYFEFKSPILEDRDLILREYDMGTKGGWLSINDIRRKEDLAEIEGGEMVYIPFSAQPLGAPMSGKTINIEHVQKFQVKEIVKDIVQSVTKEIIIEDPKLEFDKEQIEFERKGNFMAKARNQRGLEYESMFNKKLKELWNKQKKEAIKNLNSTLKTKNWRTKAINLIDKEKEIKATIDLFTPLFLALVEEEGLAAAELLLGSDEFTITPSLRKFVESNTKKFAGAITEETSTKLRSTIAAGLESGEAITDLEKRIMESVAFDLPRAEKIARTETIRTQSKATVEVWKDSGVVKAKTWFTAEDERTCPNCGPMHGKEISLNNDFFKKGEDAPGGLTIDYENVGGPPLHPQCRCTLIPIVE